MKRFFMIWMLFIPTFSQGGAFSLSKACARLLRVHELPASPLNQVIYSQRDDETGAFIYTARQKKPSNQTSLTAWLDTGIQDYLSIERWAESFPALVDELGFKVSKSSQKILSYPDVNNLNIRAARAGIIWRFVNVAVTDDESNVFFEKTFIEGLKNGLIVIPSSGELHFDLMNAVPGLWNLSTELIASLRKTANLLSDFRTNPELQSATLFQKGLREVSASFSWSLVHISASHLPSRSEEELMTPLLVAYEGLEREVKAQPTQQGRSYGIPTVYWGEPRPLRAFLSPGQQEVFDGILNQYPK